MSPRAQLSGGLSADDPLRVEYEHGKEERTSLRDAVPSPRKLFRRLRVVPLQRPFHGSTMGQWPTNFQPQTRGSPMNANIVPTNWSMSTPEQKGQRSTSSQHFQEEEQSAQLEKTIRESTVELPLSKPDVRKPSAIQSQPASASKGPSGNDGKAGGSRSRLITQQPNLPSGHIGEQ